MLESLDEGGEDVPFFMFGGADEWLEEHAGCNVAGALDTLLGSPAEVIACLESVLIGEAADRATFEKGLEMAGGDEAKRREWKEHWLEQRRGSTNNIGARAQAWADSLRAKRLGPAAPQQIFTSKEVQS